MEINAHTIGIRTMCEAKNKYCSASSSPPAFPELQCLPTAEIVESADHVNLYDVQTGKTLPFGTGSNPIQFIGSSPSFANSSVIMWCSTTVTKVNYTAVSNQVHVRSSETSPVIHPRCGSSVGSSQRRHTTLLFHPSCNPSSPLWSWNQYLVLSRFRLPSNSQRSSCFGCSWGLI